MPKKANDVTKAGAIESVRSYFAGERPGGPPPKPFWLTYTGGDVVQVKGVGIFQNGTTAEVGPATAARFREEPDWVVRERKRPARDEDEDAASKLESGETTDADRRSEAS